MVNRKTNEVNIVVEQNDNTTLDCDDQVLGHLLETLCFYLETEFRIEAYGDIRHHLWEDTGIALGEELAGSTENRPVARYGTAVRPMDEALVMVAVDLSRPYLQWDLDSTTGEPGFEPALAKEFLRALARSIPATVHVHKFTGSNIHHVMEATFKALGAGLSQALRPSSEIQSTKGTL